MLENHILAKTGITLALTSFGLGYGLEKAGLCYKFRGYWKTWTEEELKDASKRFSYQTTDRIYTAIGWIFSAGVGLAAVDAGMSTYIYLQRSLPVRVKVEWGK